MGLSPPGSNKGEVIGYNTTPTFVENLYSEGVIDNPIWGMYVAPLGEDGVAEGSGEITFGGVDESRISGACADAAASPFVD